jgi:hypothetical protein
MLKLVLGNICSGIALRRDGFVGAYYVNETHKIKKLESRELSIECNFVDVISSCQRSLLMMCFCGAEVESIDSEVA